MKKDRNCGATPYPIYQNNAQFMPMMPVPNQMNMMPNMMPNMMNQSQIPTTYSSNSIEQQLNNISMQIRNLDARVSSLENLVGSNNSSYNTSNFQMM